MLERVVQTAVCVLGGLCALLAVLIVEVMAGLCLLNLIGEW